MKYSVRNIIIAYVFVIAGILLILFITFNTLSSQERTQVEISRAREVLQILGPTLSDMQLLEFTRDGYGHHPDTAHLGYFERILQDLRGDLQKINDLKARQGDNQESYQVLQTQLSGMIDTAGKVLVQLRAKPAVAHSMNSIGYIQRFRKVSNQLEEQNRQILNESYAHSIDDNRRMFAYISILSGLMILLLLLTCVLIMRDIGNLRSAELHLKKFNERLETQVVNKTAEIRKSEERYRSVVEQASDSIMVTDPQGNFIDVNSAMCKQFGYTPEEFFRLNITNLIDPEQLKSDPIRFDLMGKGISFSRQRRMIHKNGTIVEVEVNVKKIADGRIMAIARDISERKRVEELIRKERDLSDSVINSLPGIFYLITRDFKYLRWNDEFESVSGYSKDEIPKLNPLDFFEGKDRENVDKGMRDVFNEGSSQLEATVVTRSGKKIPYFFTGQAIRYEGQPCLIGTGIDITERKELEDAFLNQQIQGQKMITRAVLQAEERERNIIGQELHDNVNQILASAKLYLSMAEVDLELRETLIRNSMTYIENAIQEIRSLSKSQVTPLRIIDLKELVEDLLNEFDQKTFIKTNLNFNVSDQMEVQEDLKLNVYRVIQEQLNNILKHSQAEMVSVSVEGNNGWLQVRIVDNGKGFSLDKKRNGIGISNMTNRVESYNGEIKIDTSPGKGCVVDVKIPV